MQQTVISPLAKRLSPYVPGEQPKGRQKIIKLNTNENPYPPSPRVAPAVAQAMEHLRLYPDPTSHALRQAITKAEGLSVEEVFVGNGSDEVLGLCFPAFFAGQAQPVQFADITYSFYEVYAQLFGVAVQKIPLTADFCIDLPAFCQGAAGGILIPNPNAPTGIALTLSEIEQILHTNPQCLVLIDEAYVAFGAQSAASLIGRYENLLVVRTLSKSHALAGLRVGYALGNRQLIHALTSVKDSFNSYPVDQLAQAGAQAAIEDAAYTQARCEEIQATRTWFCQELRDRGFTVLPSQANFVFASPPDGDGKGFFAKLRARQVLVRHFDKPRISGYLRITIGTREEMQALLDALDEEGQ